MMISINNTPWEIKFVSQNSQILMNPNGEYTLGVTILENNTIYLSDELCGEKLHHVLSHELFHAEMLSRNIYVPSYIEEALADIVADHALEVFELAEDAHDNLCLFYGKC